MRQNKAQASIELIILSGFLLFFFIAIIASVMQNTESKVQQKKDIALKDIAMSVQDEINMALGSSEGYSRVFELPEKAVNDDYNISIVGGSVYIKTTDNRHALALPIPNVTGNLNAGKNIIKKQNETIYLN